MRVFGDRSGREDAGPVGGGERTDESIVKRASKAGSPGCVVGFFSIFALFGLAFLIPFFILPLARSLRAQSWPAVPCTIVESAVGVHGDSDGDTYSIDVRYTYELNGRTYEGTRYKFFGGSSSGREAKQAVIDQLPPGTHAACYVDPRDPASAVIDRGVGLEYLIGLVPMTFLAVGVGGMAWSLRVWRRARHRPPPPAPAPPGGGFTALGPSSPATATTLKPKMGPVGRFLGILFVAAFWNGIVGIFAFHAYDGWRGGQLDGCLTIFLIPFGLIGLLLLAALPYQFLSLFNPRPSLELDRGGLLLGATSTLRWSFSGWPGRIRQLKLTIEAREEATYRRGTTSTTDKSIFYRATVLETEDRLSIPQGQVQVSLPADLAPSFEAPHNKIVWVLKVHGDIRTWPDVNEELNLPVLALEGPR